ncbi:hypothetical protein [Microcoleus sp. bin38.metabat.b11b12b14.051]|nr:hypothetical protein [Microcoleus sp. bin38.metabat.b11b12b14.051]
MFEALAFYVVLAALGFTTLYEQAIAMDITVILFVVAVTISQNMP